MNHSAAGRLRSGLLIWAMALTAALPSHLAVPAPADAASSALSPAAGTADEGIGPGAPGLGDPYYPLDGNGGYDVEHYLLKLSYDPPTGLLAGSATIRARTTGNLSAFNLDLDGLTVRAVRVNGREAAFSRSGAELTVTPKKAIRDGREFEAVIDYDGVPKLLVDQFGPSGFFRTDDGSLVIGQPHVAATWFPSNDHPLDKASFTFKITVPDGLEVVANGVLRDKESEDGKATWTWQASEPMATYLATASVGRFRLDRYRQDRISYVDAIDPDLFDPVVTAKTGRNFAWSHSSLNSYTRLTRTIDVPSTGASLSFALQRDTEPQFDFALVEAHVAGSASWTTLRDVRGHTTDNPGAACRGLLALHPFLKHYLTDKGDGTCAPSGSTGQWWAATGSSRGWEPWAFNLGRFAGKKVDISITYVSDGVLPFDGVFIDDIAVSTGEGSTSFEEDGNKLDGWTASSPPAGSPPNTVRWTAGADRPSPLGKRVQTSFTRQPEVISFLSGYFGRYPFKAAGGTVDDLEGLGFALENQTRPIYSKIFFKDPQSGDSVVVHELAHQWVGDDVTVRGWQDIWLNEGFATYAEWLWSESEGRETPQQLFDFYAAAIPAKSPFWAVKIGDPGTASLFDAAVYIRGAMTLQALRVRIGDELFFQALRTWTAEHAGGNVSSSDFISHVQDIAGENLAGFFQEWLFSPAKPSGAGPTPQLKAPPSGPSAAVRQLSSPPATVRLLEQRLAARAGKD